MTEHLPFTALPELSKLLDQLCQTLNHEMQHYEVHKDLKHFQQLLNALGRDLSEFTKSIDAWHGLATTPGQYDQVQAIELRIDEARHLMTKAIGLLKAQ